MFWFLQNLNNENISFFFSGLLIGTIITKSFTLFDLNNKLKRINNDNNHNNHKSSIVKQSHYKNNNFSIVEKSEYNKLLETNRKLLINNTELNERLDILVIANRSKINYLENENKILTQFANNVRNYGIFGFNIVKNPNLYSDVNCFGYSYRSKQKSIIVGNNVIVKQSSFEV